MRSGNEHHEVSVPVGCDIAPLVSVVRSACAGRFGLDAGLEWGCLDNPGLRGAAEELQRAIGALQHHQRRVLGLIDDRKAYAAVGSRDAADWAAGQLGMSRKAAAEGIEVAKKLEAFPALAEKAEVGELSPEQAAPAWRWPRPPPPTATPPPTRTWAVNAPAHGRGRAAASGGEGPPTGCGRPRRGEGGPHPSTRGPPGRSCASRARSRSTTAPRC